MAPTNFWAEVVARGADACARKRKFPGLHIVSGSGYSETITLDQIAGAVVLRKPFDVEGLDRALNSVLD